MRIISYLVRGKTLIVTTDNLDRPEFAYPLDRFHSVEALENEINKSIEFEAWRKNRTQQKEADIVNALDARRITRKFDPVIPEIVEVNP